jgi:uncharacterized protein (TIGR02266 family)
MAQLDPTVAARRWERADVNIAVVCRGRDEALRDFARKLGAGGMFIETPHPKPIGSRVELQFNLPGMDGPVELAGKVAWVREVERSAPGGMGIAFEGVEDQLRDQIDRLVQALNTPSVAP